MMKWKKVLQRKLWIAMLTVIVLSQSLMPIGSVSAAAATTHYAVDEMSYYVADGEKMPYLMILTDNQVGPYVGYLKFQVQPGFKIESAKLYLSSFEETSYYTQPMKVEIGTNDWISMGNLPTSVYGPVNVNAEMTGETVTLWGNYVYDLTSWDLTTLVTQEHISPEGWITFILSTDNEFGVFLGSGDLVGACEGDATACDLARPRLMIEYGDPIAAGPAAPTISAPADGTVTNDSTPTISGTAEPGVTVTVLVGGSANGTTTADGDGNWSYTPSMGWSDGLHSVTATAMNGGGNTSAASAAVSVTIDTVAPAAPVIVSPTNGSLTNDATPTISGTAEAGSTVKLLVGGTEIGTTTADGGGSWSYTPSIAWSDGTHSVTATATDIAGNTSAASTAVNVEIDANAPAAPVIGSPTDGTVTKEAKPTISGTAEAGSTVKVLVGGMEIGTTAADGGGDWSYTPSMAWSDGQHSVTATATDAAGNTSAVSASVSVIVDTVAPAAPVIASPTNGSSTNDETPTISGTAEAGSTVRVFVGGTEIGTTTADGTGNWSYTPSMGWSDGPHSVTATATDAAGNTSAASAAVSVTIDTVVPAAPTIIAPADGSYTNDATPAISGTAEAGSTVTVLVGGSANGTTTADGTGNWSYTPSIAWSDGTHSVAATATDAAGNTSAASAAVSVTIDATAPAAPVIVSPANGSHTGNTKPTISGTAEAGSTVTVIVDGTVLAATTANGSGNWTYTPSMAWSDGTHSVTATATDAAGNTSAVSTAVSVTVDTVAPAAPVIVSPTNGSSTNDATPTISGTAEPGSTVTVLVGGTEMGTTTANGTGNWSYTPGAGWSDGTHSVTATATDAAGNTSAASAAVSVTIDATAPAAPVIVSPANGSHTGNTKPTISGTAEAGSTVTVIVDGTVIAAPTADGSGNWSYTPNMAWSDGTHSITATATDAAGNTSAVSTAVSVTVDTVAPAAPVIVSPTNGSSTNDATPTISGTAEAGSTVTVIVGGTVIGTTTADGTGNWSYTPNTAWSEDSHSITATATDAVGNTSVVSAATNVTVDTTAPSAPTIGAPVDGTVTNDGTPTISGTAEAGSKVKVFVGGVENGTTTADGGGNWSYTPSSDWPDGTHSVTATATDAAGNASAASAAVSLTIDATAPAAPVIGSPTDGSSTNDATPTISGTAEAGSTVKVFVGGAENGTTTANGSGSWSYTPSVAWSDGTHSVTATATDAAGNTSAASAAVSLTIDTIAPGAPTIITPADNSVTNDSTPTISGTAEAGSTVTVLAGGTVIGTTTADGGGNWSYTPEAAWSDGSHSVTATATDAAGNASNGTTIAVIVDATAPVITLVGASSVRVQVGTAYADAGATALDAIDGDLTSAIQENHNVNVNLIGTYTVNYQVSDSAGHSASVQREVIVTPSAVVITANQAGQQSISVTQAVPSAQLTLFNGSQVQIGDPVSADAEGNYTFTEVPYGAGYYVVQTISGIDSDPSNTVNLNAPAPTSSSTGTTNGDTRQVKVSVDGTNSAEEVEITRRLNESGKKEDAVVLNLDKATSVVAKAIEQQRQKATILIDDLEEDPAEEIAASVPLNALTKLSSNGIALEIRTEGATVEIPAATMQALADLGIDLYFRLVPIRKDEEKQQVVTRTITSEQVREAAGDQQVQVIGTPMQIETNYTNLNTKVVFPLDGIQLPSDSAELQRVLNSLAVYIEHSDGEKKLQRGQIVMDASGQPVGIEIEINKFSTFVVVQIDDELHTPYINGYGDGTFQPNRTVTRAELATMLARLLQDQWTLEEKQGAVYDDVVATHWAYRYIADLGAHGVVTGYPDGTFRPDQAVTRAEFASIMARIMGDRPDNGRREVQDIDGHWAVQSIQRVLAAGLMTGYGDGSFRPNEGLSRAEAVTALNRLFSREPQSTLKNPYSDVTRSHWAYGHILEASIEHARMNHNSE